MPELSNWTRSFVRSELPNLTKHAKNVNFRVVVVYTLSFVPTYHYRQRMQVKLFVNIVDKRAVPKHINQLHGAPPVFLIIKTDKWTHMKQHFALV